MKYLVFPGSFKPPHVGHFKIIEKYVKDKTIDKIFIFISQKPRLIYPPFNKKTYQLSSNELKNTCKVFLKRKNCNNTNKEIVKKIDKAVNKNEIPGITLEQSYTIWNYYLDLLTDKHREKVKLFKSRLPSPVLFSFVVVRNMVKKGDELLLIKSKKDESNNRFSLFDNLKKNKVKINELAIPIYKNFNSFEMRKLIYERKRKEFMQYLPKKLDNTIKIKIWNMLRR